MIDRGRKLCGGGMRAEGRSGQEDGLWKPEKICIQRS